MTASSKLEILIAARNESQSALDKLNRDLRDSAKSSDSTAKSAREVMSELNKANRAQRDIDRLNKYIHDLGGEAEQSGGKLSRMWASIGLGGNVRIGQAIDIGPLTRFAAVAGGAGVALNWAKDRMGEAMDNASALNETMSKSAVVFGTASSEVEKFGSSAATSIGMSKQQAVEAAASVGNLFLSVGMTQKESAKLSTSIVQLAGDLSSFNNISGDEALEKLRSGLVGEAEPLRTLGVLLSEAAVQQKALALGLTDNASKLTESQKVMARYAIVMEQTKTAQGDFARTSEGAANSQRVLDAQMANLSARMGAMTLPIRTGVITALNDLLKSQEDMRGSQRRANDMIAAGTPTSLAYAQAAREVAGRLDDTAAAADRAQKGIKDVSSRMTEFLDEAPVDISKLAAKAAAASDLADAFVQRNSIQAAIDRRGPIVTDEDRAAASDLADSFNRVNSAAGLVANTENKLEEQQRRLTEQTKAETEANKARTEAMQRAQSAVAGLQSAINDLNRTPLLGQGAFDEKQVALQARIDQIDAAQRELVMKRGSRTELRNLARERVGLESQLGLSEAQERAVMGPQQRELQKLLNPSLPEMSLEEIRTRAAAARAGLAAVQSYQTTINNSPNVTINIDASGNLTATGADAGMTEAMGRAARAAVLEVIAEAGRAPAAASAGVAGNW